MGRFKVKKQNLYIDMTPMSDVMVLLLTFFMLTATFVKEEPVKVNTPGSVSEVKIPETNLLTIFVEKNGKVFMTMDSPENLRKLARQMNESGAFQDLGYSNLTEEEISLFGEVPTFGTTLSTLKGWLKQDHGARNKLLTSNNPSVGIPCGNDENDTLQAYIPNEFITWVSAARAACGENLRIAIKADQSTPYAVIKKVMNSLRQIDENRYNLITALKTSES